MLGCLLTSNCSSRSSAHGGSARVWLESSAVLGRLGDVKPSERLKRDAEALLLFRNAYVELVNHARPHRDDMYAMVELRSGTDHATWQRKRTDVSSAAGMAGAAYGRHGGTMTLRNAAYIMHDVDPLTNWEMSLRDPEQMSPETVISSVDSAIARARQLSQEAAARERGITGLIAAFLRWPSNLREAVGPGPSAQRTAAGLIGVAGQVVVGAITAALTAGLIAGVVALWQLAF